MSSDGMPAVPKPPIITVAPSPISATAAAAVPTVLSIILEVFDVRLPHQCSYIAQCRAYVGDRSIAHAQKAFGNRALSLSSHALNVAITGPVSGRTPRHIRNDSAACAISIPRPSAPRHPPYDSRLERNGDA